MSKNSNNTNSTKKDNMKQAMYEMFGVGSDNNAKPSEPQKEAVKVKSAETQVKPEVKTKPAASCLAAGTVLEGTLRAEGDVDIAGGFKGTIDSKGAVNLRSDVESQITASNLNLYNCKLIGDVVVSGIVAISEHSEIKGNITAQELLCAGKITGNMTIAENIALESTAQINGNITTGAISVVKGAVINGGIEIKAAK